MLTRPEVLFHEVFQLQPPDVRLKLRGRLDLATLPPPGASFLTGVREALNESLRNEKQNVSAHVEHPPFHFDYIDSDIPAALSFRYEGYSFIGISLPLFHALWDSCVALNKSNGVAALLEIPLPPEPEEAILTVMFQTQLALIRTHEYTHHVHGHFKGASKLEGQAFELDADGYGVFHVLAHLIKGPRRAQATELLGCADKPAEIQDVVLFHSFVMAMTALLLVLPRASVNLSTVYGESHPPKAARLNGIMRSAMSWCEQNRPALVTAMSKNTFQTITIIVARAMSEINVNCDWSEETSFLKSENGSQYSKELWSRYRSHVQSL
jgi:hypothetical protein